MPVGAVREQGLVPSAERPAAVITARVRRLALDRYAASVTVRVEAEGGAGSLAVRRVRLLLERALVADSAAPRDTARVVMPIARWRVVEVW
jgi:hypothetical protein